MQNDPPKEASLAKMAAIVGLIVLFAIVAFCLNAPASQFIYVDF